MRNMALAILVPCVMICMIGCTSNQPTGTNTSQVQKNAVRSETVPDGIDPKQTSDDPTYGYSAKKPIKVGGPKGFSGPSSEQLYLRHLRDSQYRPFRFERLGSFGGNPDNHIVDGYELTDQDGKTITIYIDMYHEDIHPFHVKAPKGMYFWK